MGRFLILGLFLLYGQSGWASHEELALDLAISAHNKAELIAALKASGIENDELAKTAVDWPLSYWDELSEKQRELIWSFFSYSDLQSFLGKTRSEDPSLSNHFVACSLSRLEKTCETTLKRAGAFFSVTPLASAATHFLVQRLNYFSPTTDFTLSVSATLFAFALGDWIFFRDKSFAHVFSEFSEAASSDSGCSSLIVDADT